MHSYSAVAGFVFLSVLLFASSAGVNECRAQSSRIDVLDPHLLPLGDGKVSTGPVRGYVYSCRSQFRGGGAQHGIGRATVHGYIAGTNAAQEPVA